MSNSQPSDALLQAPKKATQPRTILREALLTISITLLFTLLLSLLSILFGGFGSQNAMRSSQGVSMPIIVHAATAIPALLLGPVLLLRRKGDALHRWLGRGWGLLMIATAIASAFIRSPGAGFFGSGFSFLHLFTAWTLLATPVGIWFAATGRISAHRGVMVGMYTGLVIAGAFSMIPGRLLGNLAFG